MRPPFETFRRATCKGSYALGTACGRCEKCEWERSQSGKPALAPSGFEQWAVTQGYCITTAVSPCGIRKYADGRTQEAFEAWNAGEASASKDIIRSMVDGLSPEELASAGIV